MLTITILTLRTYRSGNLQLAGLLAIECATQCLARHLPDKPYLLVRTIVNAQGLDTYCFETYLVVVIKHVLLSHTAQVYTITLDIDFLFR